MNQIERFRQIQKEQMPWVIHNFGDRPSFYPLLGVVEEFGELAVAHENGSDDEAKDSLADVAIFACDYATARRWDMGDMIEAAETINDVPFDSLKLMLRVMQSMGRLAHAHLKEAQGIRLHENHEAEAWYALADLLACARSYAVSCDWDFEMIVWDTWRKVRERDWKADPETAHKE